jgi:hypothetical protein
MQSQDKLNETMRKKRIKRLKTFEQRLHEEEMILELASYGFHGAVIANRVGLKSISKVYSVCSQNGVKLRDYRDGINKVAKRVITGIVKQSIRQVS